jgi:hypothetical protein
VGRELGGVPASTPAALPPHVPERTIPIPSKRNLRKFGRDFGVAVFGFAAIWLGSNYTELELSAETVAIGTPIALYLYRQARKALGMEPA